jgi:hypothetical protein
MSTLRVISQQTVLRVAPGGQMTLKVSRAGIQGPPGGEGQPGQDGAANIPSTLRGGNF